MAERAVEEMGIYVAASRRPPKLQLHVRLETTQSGIHKHVRTQTGCDSKNQAEEDFFFLKFISTRLLGRKKWVRWFMFERFKASSSDPCAAREKVES